MDRPLDYYSVDEMKPLDGLQHPFLDPKVSADDGHLISICTSCWTFISFKFLNQYSISIFSHQLSKLRPFLIQLPAGHPINHVTVRWNYIEIRVEF
jgi:hypothetical protein